MNLKKSFFVAAIFAIVALTCWEFYWRAQGYHPELEDNKALWAVQRGKVNYASSKDIVLLGDSRMLFDLQLDAWEKETGIRPIQLASAGTTPLPAFHDLVENTDFSGTVLLSVHPGIFFSSTDETAFLWRRIKVRIDHYYDRTYAQKLNHFLDIPLQYTFTFLRSDDEEWTDDLNLKNLVNNIRVGNREGEPFPPFYRFQDIAIDRNTKMYDKVVTDTAFANSIIKVWMGDGGPPPEKEATMAYFLKDLEKFKSRGGRVISVRFPSSGGLLKGEEEAFPRKDFWDELKNRAEIPAYHYKDYAQLNSFYCPEWSHLSASDADTFTTELVKILKKDKVLIN